MPKTLILIPSRMSARRLPGKPLLKINNLAIISHVVKKAQQTGIGDVFVATEDQEIINEVKKMMGKLYLPPIIIKPVQIEYLNVFKN